MKMKRKNALMASASVIALIAGLAFAPAPAAADSYMAGDFHNHTTCNDGATSVQTMVTTSLSTFGLEWLGDSGHGGSFTRDCRFDDPEGDAQKTGSGMLFETSVGVSAFKGDVVNSTSNSPDGLAHRAMWEWQIIQDYHYPITAELSRSLDKTMVWIGTEQNVPGHEHASTAVITGQNSWSQADYGNPYAAAEYEYRFDRSDTDFSGGAPDHAWSGKVANASGAGQGTANHINKAVPGVAWMQANYPVSSYFVPAHAERAGVFDPNNNRGYNVEHFRDFNNAGPTVAFGFETMPGHQASNTRGEYRKDFGGPGIDSAGVTTYGGTGVYGAKVGGVWDALLGEGRNWFFYASSDFHNRGAFSPFVRQSTQDFYPGEYQKLYVPRPDKNGTLKPQDVVDQIRSGNSFSVAGDLISSDFTFQATSGKSKPAKMGQTLVVKKGQDVTITLTVNLPTGTNNSPYSFPNPSLAQIGVTQPLNMPVLDHVDFIRGNVTGVIAPGSANYTNGTNPSAQVIRTFNNSNWVANGQSRTMTFVIPNVQNSQYVRVRGTNLPPAVPNETDASGNPLSDLPTSAIPCLDAACPAHMQVVGGQKRSSFDVASWADLWFYGNPIFIRVSDDSPLLVETNAQLAQQLRDAL
jgi:hypothetical protein